MSGVDINDPLRDELMALVSKEIELTATVDKIQFSLGLPQTRSGKIKRRILRKIAEHDFSNLGDTPTLTDSSVVEDLINNRI